MKIAQNVEVPDFAQRLRAVFKYARDAEIARQLGYRSQSPIAKWFDGETYPSAEVLLKIAQITQCNLHWLLTGEGLDDTDPFHFLGKRLRHPLERIAELRRERLEELALRLLCQALRARCVELLMKMQLGDPALPLDEYEELRLLLTIFMGDGDLEARAAKFADHVRSAPTR